MLPYFKQFADFAIECVGTNRVWLCDAEQMAGLLIAFSFVDIRVIRREEAQSGFSEATIQDLGSVPDVMPRGNINTSRWLYVIDLPLRENTVEITKPMIMEVRGYEMSGSDKWRKDFKVGRTPYGEPKFEMHTLYTPPPKEETKEKDGVAVLFG